MLRSFLLVIGLQQPAAPAPAPAPDSGPRDTLHLLAVGDINLGRRLAKEHLERGDTLYPFRDVADTLRASDLLFGNLESPIAPETHRVESAGVVFTIDVSSGGAAGSQRRRSCPSAVRSSGLEM